MEQLPSVPTSVQTVTANLVALKHGKNDKGPYTMATIERVKADIVMLPAGTEVALGPVQLKVIQVAGFDGRPRDEVVDIVSVRPEKAVKA